MRPEAAAAPARSPPGRPVRGRARRAGAAAEQKAQSADPACYRSRLHRSPCQVPSRGCCRGPRRSDPVAARIAFARLPAAEAQNGAVVQKRAVDFAALAVERRGYFTGHGLLVGSSAGAIRRPIVGDGDAAHQIGDRVCVDQRQRACLQPAHRHLITRPYRKHDLARHVRRDTGTAEPGPMPVVRSAASPPMPPRRAGALTVGRLAT